MVDKSLIGIYKVTSEKLNAKEGPGTSYNVIGTMEKGVRVDVIEVVNKDWYKINTKQGGAYVFSKYLQRSP